MTTQDKVEHVLTEMLRDQVTNMTTLDGDDWQMRNVFDVGDRVYLRCAFYEDPQRGDYIWEVQDQTSVELDITDSPEPSDGGNAVVECDVAERIDGERIRLENPKIVDIQVAEDTAEELSKRL